MDLLSFFKKSESEKYEREKALALEGSESKRIALAKNEKTHKEILFYLAEKDESEKVRKAVAKNKSTPLHASTALAKDGSQDVRLALAHRLIQILPEVSLDTQSRLYAFTVQALGTLALDKVLKIKKALTATLKDHAYAPPAVAIALAKDIEREVSEPILRLCTVIKDEDLIDILQSHPADWAAEAVAQRKTIGARLSLAVIKKENKKAGQLLLNNKGAEIDEEVLYEVIERARDFPEWHEPLVTNHSLPPELATRLSRFVDSSIRKLLLEKGQYDSETIEMISDATKRRMAMDSSGDDEKTIKQKVHTLYAQNALDETLLSDHLAMRDKEFIVIALSFMVNAKIASVRKVFSYQKPKLVCAICWKAGLSMRFALRLQQELAQISSKELIYPKEGVDYPLTPEEMEWQLEFIGL
ncbi:MAG: DUF2336 domain-containing protein [Pseudomonadota bacterium]